MLWEIIKGFLDLQNIKTEMDICQVGQGVSGMRLISITSEESGTAIEWYGLMMD